MTPKIETRHLSFRYESHVEALTDISLSIEQGEIVALLGHNGSGKSTLVKHLNGLLRPTQGEVLINGEPTEGQKIAELAGKAALLFQNPDDQICKGTVREEMVFGPNNLGYGEQRTQELAHRFLSAFDLLPMEEKNPHDLGFSERKRLAIASVMAMDTGIVVLDEPTAGLDPREIALLENAIHQLRREDKIVVIISHDMDFIAENADRAICLGQGRKLFDGNLIELFADTRLLDQCGLLPPQVARLASRCDVNLRTITPQGFIDALHASKTENTL